MELVSKIEIRNSIEVKIILEPKNCRNLSICVHFVKTNPFGFQKQNCSTKPGLFLSPQHHHKTLIM